MKKVGIRMIFDSEIISERSTAMFSTDLKDETGADILLDDLNYVLLTLYEKESGSIINGRNKQNVLNQNGVVITTEGTLIWTLSPEDTAIVNPETPVFNPPKTQRTEEHIALFELTYDDTKETKFEVEFKIANLDKVP